MAGAIQRLYGQRVVRLSPLPSAGSRLIIVGAVTPVAVGVDGQIAVAAVHGGSGKLRFPGIGIADVRSGWRWRLRSANRCPCR